MVERTGVKPNEEIDEASAKEWVENYLNYLRNGDAEGWASLWEDDAIILPPNMPPVHGLEAWRRMVEPSFGKYSNSYETIDLKVYAERTMAYVRWIGVATNVPKSGGEPMRNENKSVWLLRRGRGGSLKAVECIWSHNHPPRGERSFVYEK